MDHRAGSGEGWVDGCGNARVKEGAGFRLFARGCVWLGLFEDSLDCFGGGGGLVRVGWDGDGGRWWGFW